MDLTATSSWSVTSFSNSSIVFDVTITNTTDLGAFPGTNAAILSFGLATNPTATGSLTDPGTVFTEVTPGQGAPQNFPGGYSGINICIWAGENCAGGSVNDGLQAGSNSDSFELTLTGDFGDLVSLVFFPIKFQSTWGSFEPGGSTPVPAPSALAILGAGLIGLALVRRRRAG